MQMKVKRLLLLVCAFAPNMLMAQYNRNEILDRSPDRKLADLDGIAG